MKAIMPNLQKNGEVSQYLQLYDYIRSAILNGEIQRGEALPSLRALAQELGISITTVQQAYNQLSVEGYIYSKPQSGYYVSDFSFAPEWADASPGGADSAEPDTENDLDRLLDKSCEGHTYDLSCFDFNKWKKCTNKILTERPEVLTFESDPQGEEALRYEISKYVYRARGVTCSRDQVVIGAGTQQITSHLSRILTKMNINHVAVEEPGYLPVKNIFRERGFVMTPVEVGHEGIKISALPANIRSAVYVSPSNQFPTGAVMPIGRRYELLDWANRNDSIIIEDDYDSELRYFGRPVPALQGLDGSQRVVYLGSFSATLFPAVKISYMVLTPDMARIFMEMRENYTQTCSKTEQLTLALFMEKGFYQTGLKKTRSLYAQKLQAVTEAVSRYGGGKLSLDSASSGLNVVIHADYGKSARELCAAAKKLGISAMPISAFADNTDEETGSQTIVLYYNQIPLAQIDEYIKKLISLWRS